MVRIMWVLIKLTHGHRVAQLEAAVSLLLMLILCSGQSAAVTRFIDRSLLINNSEPGATTTYTITLQYNSLTAVGSLDMLFCYDPIPTDPCVAPAGLDVSNATLSAQTGETGFSLTTLSASHLLLSRPPAVVGSETSTYTFTGVVNPSDTSQSFAIRLSDYASTDASGTLIDLGSVVSEATPGITVETQVPPILIFCLAQQVSSDCLDDSGGNYSDLGELLSTQPLTAQSQIAVSTNATNGYVVTVNGPTLFAGTHSIPALGIPTVSVPGTNQFGINLVANTAPLVGLNPDGSPDSGFQIGPNYAIPNEYEYQDGTVVASAPHVSLGRRYTISYIVNSSDNLPAGVYTTTLTFICSGRF